MDKYIDKLTITEFHHLTNKKIKKRIFKYFEDIKSRHEGVVDNLRLVWNGDTADVKMNVIGLKLIGVIVVDSDTVTVSSNLPPPANIYKEKLENIVRNELYDLLN